MSSLGQKSPTLNAPLTPKELECSPMSMWVWPSIFNIIKQFNYGAIHAKERPNCRVVVWKVGKLSIFNTKAETKIISFINDL